MHSHSTGRLFHARRRTMFTEFAGKEFPIAAAHFCKIRRFFFPILDLFRAILSILCYNMFAASRQSRSTRLFCRVLPNTGEVGQPLILSLCLLIYREGTSHKQKKKTAGKQSFFVMKATEKQADCGFLAGFPDGKEASIHFYFVAVLVKDALRPFDKRPLDIGFLRRGKLPLRLMFRRTAAFVRKPEPVCRFLLVRIRP